MKSAADRYAPTLSQVVDRLSSLADTLHSDGLKEQATSIETTIADLQWQWEVLDSAKLEPVS